MMNQLNEHMYHHYDKERSFQVLRNMDQRFHNTDLNDPLGIDKEMMN
jgi:hypothetical protein